MICYEVSEKGSNRVVREVVLTAPIYDDIVDISTFIPDSESTRVGASSGQGSSFNGSYDGDNLPSDDVVRVRSGKLDKAEVAKLAKNKLEIAKNESDSKAKADALAQVEAVNKARQEYLDAKTGFKSVNESSVSAQSTK